MFLLRPRALLVPSLLASFVAVGACGGSAADGGASSSAATSPSGASDPGAGGNATAGPGSTSASTGGASGTGTGMSAADGSPTRVACTNTFGSTLTVTHGRLDGYVVSIVPATGHGCNADGQHLHLQIQVSGAAYDVAVNVDGLEAELDAPLPGAPWAEGWHEGATLDYTKDLGLHATSFALTGLAAVRQRLETELAAANHIAVYATGYGPTGVHLVHRQGGGRDGALVLDPLSTKPHIVAFRFDTQSF